jgi:mono/diheme cytochrome c family protein
LTNSFGAPGALMADIARAFGFWAATLSLLPSAAAAAPDMAAQDGERLYEKYCATCHGDDLQNNGLAFDLRRLKADEQPRFVFFVTHGKKAMPSWQGVLGADQIDALWAYVRAHAYQ